MVLIQLLNLNWHRKMSCNVKKYSWTILCWTSFWNKAPFWVLAGFIFYSRLTFCYVVWPHSFNRGTGLLEKYGKMYYIHSLIPTVWSAICLYAEMPFFHICRLSTCINGANNRHCSSFQFCRPIIETWKRQHFCDLCIPTCKSMALMLQNIQPEQNQCLVCTLVGL